MFGLETDDGIALRAALWRAAPSRGHCIFLTGRTEALEKVALPAAAFLDRGFSVASLDWRGQGFSDRLTGRERMGHVGDFTDYQRDLAALLADDRVASLSGPRVIFAHSMGGAIALRALHGAGADPGPVAGAILSAPMLGIAMTPPARAIAGVVTRVGGWLGKGEAWPPVGKPDRFYVLEPFEGNVLTGDADVYAWLQETLRAEPRLGLGWPSIGWLGAATAEMAWLAAQHHAPETPLLYLLGAEEKVVDPARVRESAARFGAKLVEVPDGRHEVLIDTAEVRAAAWEAIDAFLADVMEPAQG